MNSVRSKNLSLKYQKFIQFANIKIKHFYCYNNCPKRSPSSSKNVKGAVDITSSESDISDSQRYPLNLWSSKKNGDIHILLAQDRPPGCLRLYK